MAVLSREALLAVILIVVLIAPAHADVVWLKSGDRVSGNVDSLDSSTLRIDTEWGGVLLIKRDAIASIDTERELNLELPDGERTTARLQVDDEGRQVVVDDAGERPLNVAVIQQASVNALTGRPKDRWESRLTYGLNISDGNSDTESHALRAHSLLRRGAFRHAVNADVDLKKDDGNTTRELYRVGYQLDWFFQDDWYAFGSSEYFQDKLREVDYRVTLGLGVGYQFWDTSLGAFSVESGISEVIEKVGGESDNNRAFRLGADYNRFFMGKRLELFHRNEVLVLAERDRGELLQTSTGLHYALNSFLSTNVRIDFDHETEPAPGRKKSDVTYIIGIGFTW